MTTGGEGSKSCVGGSFLQMLSDDDVLNATPMPNSAAEFSSCFYVQAGVCESRRPPRDDGRPRSPLRRTADLHRAGRVETPLFTQAPCGEQQHHVCAGGGRNGSSAAT